MSSPVARTVYRPLDGWANQLSVAARSYVPYLTTTSTSTSYAREPWRQYIWDGFNSAGDNGLLYFHSGEAGKSIMVDYEYSLDGTNFVKVIGQILTINEDLTTTRPAPVPSAFSASGQVASVQFTDSSGQAISPSSATTYPRVTAILAVRGVGVRSRVAWLSGARYTQVTMISYRSQS